MLELGSMKLRHKKPYGVCIVGSYDLHLYCANVHTDNRKFPEEIVDCATFKEASAEARKRGWKIISVSDLAFCPDCTKAKNY